MSYASLWTYQDAVEHVLDVFDSERDGRPLRMARRACREALRELSAVNRWAYYQERGTLHTAAQQTSGTITYTHSSRTVTLSGATFPTDADRYRITIDSVDYSIDHYVDSTNIVLPEHSNPGEDVSAGSAYVLYRDTYELPEGFTELYALYDVANRRPVHIELPERGMAQRVVTYQSPGEPWYASIVSSAVTPGLMALRFVPPPDTARSYEYMYHRRPHPLRTELYNTGTVSTTAGSSTVSISTGSFSSVHVGAVLRIGDATHYPTSYISSISGDDEPYVEQRRIVAVASDGSSCTVDRTMDNTASAVRFTVSDVLDIDYETMLAAYLRMAELEFTKITKREINDRADRERLAREALLLARERDVRYVGNQWPGWYSPFRHVTITDDV